MSSPIITAGIVSSGVRVPRTPPIMSSLPVPFLVISPNPVPRQIPRPPTLIIPAALRVVSPVCVRCSARRSQMDIPPVARVLSRPFVHVFIWSPIPRTL
ncbi:hypothetical protein PHLGIDRAFT_19932 [Phlebiopsis gigantea 11061_1 CR5-6]|uniref:Uncharacterized protein n=1 Tax=Phlebiopsis gigantea (strain 11061_1 CR5-6) TaxID=745531 RepID=A0A0C3RUC1_PHLG1|nr:hypothetical protein PHLGIDRAFT_19932 [Phlebiopsis gigantea 11061_1 CR5-6]